MPGTNRSITVSQALPFFADWYEAGPVRLTCRQVLHLFTIMQGDDDEYYNSGSDVSDVSDISEPHVEDVTTSKNVFVKRVQENINHNHII